MKIGNTIIGKIRGVGSAMAVAVIAVMASGCSEVHYDGRLEAAACQANENPDSAIALLAEIKAEDLSEANRHLYDLVTIKARDKAYVDHTSDSLILDVIDYFERRGGRDSLRAEARYYGGRVYADLGDYPTALRYFQSALDLLPEGTPYLHLRGNVLSQTGGLLDDLRLYDEAIPYVEASMGLSKNKEDTLGVVQDLQLLGAIYLRAKNYDMAERLFKESISMSNNLPIKHEAKSRAYIAEVKFRKNELDSAKCYLRGTLNKVSPLVRNNVLAYGATLFYETGETDSAYWYAHQLIESDNTTNKMAGYMIILKPELLSRIPADAMMRYVDEYRTLMEKRIDENINDMTLLQQSYYNYKLHDEARTRAENETAKRNRVIGLLIVLILGVVIATLSLMVNRRNKIIALQEAREKIRYLNELLSDSRSAQNDPTGEPDNQATGKGDKMIPGTGKSADELMRTLRKETEQLLEAKRAKNVDLPETVIMSHCYGMLNEYLREHKLLKVTDELWNEIYSVLKESYPEFLSNLRLLTNGKLTSTELETAILIKLGFTTTQIGELVGRNRNTISTRKKTIGQKLIDENLTSKDVETIIRLL